MSKLRVAERVLHGGHNIPVADIETSIDPEACKTC